MERSKAHMGGGKKSKSSGKKAHEMHIKRGKSGGFIVTHHSKQTPGEMSESEDHVVPDKEALMQHIDQNMGDQQAAAPAAPPQAAPGGAPAPAPAPGM